MTATLNRAIQVANYKNVKAVLSIFFLTFLTGSQPEIYAQNASADNNIEIGIVEQLDTYMPSGIELTDEDGNLVLFDSLIDKPTVLSLVYFRCPGICSPLMEGISEVIDRSNMVLGEEYQVLTISFDPRETIDLAINKKKNYLNLMQKKETAQENWKFFVADTNNVNKLTTATGFRYKRTGNDFLHAATIIVLSPEGKITRYLNGTYFLPFELKMAVIEASKGQSGPTINKVIQFCYSYDPAGQQYVFNITRVSGIIIIFITLIIFIFLILKPKKKA